MFGENDTIGEPFDWLYINADTLRERAARNGYAVEVMTEGEHYDYLARITKKQDSMKLKVIDVELSVCKVRDYSGVNLNQPYVFTGATDEEKSLVCPVADVPENTIERNDGWKAFRIEGVLDFSLIGILSKISSCLAENGIGIFAVSTFNTDYILTKTENFDKAKQALTAQGYTIV